MSKPKKTEEDVTSTGNVVTTPIPIGTIVPLRPIFPSLPEKKKKNEEEK